MEVGRMDELGRMDSPVHRLDARVKTLTTVAFIVTVMSFSRYEVAALMPFFIYPIALMAVGGIPAGYIGRKLLIASPFALAVGMFNPLLDQRVMGSLGSHGITGGWLSFASIVLRFALTVSAALTLVAAAVASGLALLLISLVRTPAQAGGIGAGVYLVLALLGGNVTGAAAAGGAYATIQKLTPNGWLLQGWDAVMRGGGLADIVLNLVVPLLFAVVFFAVAVLRFRKRFA